MKFFLIDFDKNIFIQDIDKLEGIYFKTPSFSLEPQIAKKDCKILKKYPIKFRKYKKIFKNIIREIENGNTYLLNLTQPTKIKTNCSLLEIFASSNAKFKLYFKNKFVCFSPERFVKIENNYIYTYPMKGTISSLEKNAIDKILNNPKEEAEHIMIVDLLRNDLGIIGRDVEVTKFRFVTEIKESKLYQVSSEIRAKLNNWQNNWLELILKLLPAGSITGTPKIKTTQIIKNTEKYNRGFYTGIFGITDEKTFLDSAVIIRYIEKKKNSFFYKSGGGITIDSDPKKEYNELISKIYIPKD